MGGINSTVQQILTPPMPEVPGSTTASAQAGVDQALAQIIKTSDAAGARSQGTSDRSVSNSPLERYTTDYYAGNQVSIFLGDIWIDELTMVQYQAQQNKRPFYGYKSQRYDTVAVGTQILEGMFSLNYTHTNYLNMMINAYLTKVNPNTAMKVNESEIQDFLTQVRNNPAILENLSIPSNALTSDAINFMIKNRFAGLPFEDKATLLEEYFWRHPDDSASQGQGDVISADNLPGFDIVIAFGNYPPDRIGGGVDEFASSHTFKIVKDVRIISSSIQAGVTGDPVQEVYTFLARGVDTPLTRRPANLVK